ncbi:GNAT family N-acetyltransferase [uncultured Massilia sp.]|uniref:GNAT family N-acetyltransferase n=1 Tax=uncultured Massilia sp. TaxID=169973 RepID=UPI002584A53E|nr:GNAT family protein [uncultured Massilia sp.]
MTGEFTASVPRLHTKRLLLREYRREDFDAFAAHLADPVSAAHLGLADRHAAWRIFCSQAGLWLIHGAGWWAVEERETGRLVGTVGAFFREESAVMELGWNTWRTFWGQGFAHEAAAAVLHHALEIRREPKVRALIDPANESSLRLAMRLGLTYEAETEIYGKAVGIHSRERGGAIA